MTTTSTLRAPILPTEAWFLGLAFLAGQLLTLADRGTPGRDPLFTVLSMAFGVAVIGWFSAGVLTARWLRTAVVWVVVVASAGLDLLAVVGDGGDGWRVLHLAASLVQVVALIAFTGTGYHRAMRLQPRPPARALGSALGLALIVGALAGLTAPADPGDPDVSFELRL